VSCAGVLIRSRKRDAEKEGGKSGTEKAENCWSVLEEVIACDAGDD
jgi:hypothetical protein